MVTFAEQRILDNDAKFSAAELTRTITYNGTDIPALVEYGPGLKRLPSDGIGAETTITVRRADIATTAKGTPVLVDGEAWQVWAKIGGNPLNVRISLISKSASPVPRRSL